MALSTKAAKALELANYCLPMLYATDYFTEEEWIRMDGLIHKGKYVWTQGPVARHLLDGSPLLMSADKSGRATTGTAEIDESLDLTDTTPSNSVQLPSPPESRSTNPETSPVHAPKSNAALLVDFSSAVTSERSEPSPPSSQVAPRRILTRQKSPDPLTQENLSTIAQQRPNIAELTEEFKRRNGGREPRSVQDIYQPRNPEHWSNRSLSRASVKTTKSVVPTPVPQPAPSGPGAHRLNVPSGTLLIAQKDIMIGKNNKGPKISIRAGDRFKYDKYVSGLMHIGLNLRTGERGQVSEEFFQNARGDYTDAMASLDSMHKPPPPTTKTRNTSMSSADLRAGIDRMVELNAAEWNAQSDNEDESVVSELPKVMNPPKALPRGKAHNWAEEMNSIVEEPKEGAPDMMKAMIDGVSEMFEEKFQKYMREKEENMNGTVPSAEKLNQSRTPWAKNAAEQSPTAESIKPPKTQTCWFWQYKTCRFTAEECHDLHELTDTVPVLKNGRPTWGDVASAKTPTPASPLLASDLLPPVPDPKGRRYICHFWANGYCTHSADDCKYLHSNAGERIALAPGVARRMLRDWGTKPPSSSWKEAEGDEKSNAKDKMLWREIPKADSSRGVPKADESNENDTATKNPFSLLQDEDEAPDTAETGSLWVPDADDECKAPHVLAMKEHLSAQAGWEQGQVMDEVPGYW